MRKIANFLLACLVSVLVVLGLALALQPAQAADAAAAGGGAVAIPWGDWLAAALAWGRDLLVYGVIALVGLAMRRLPASIVTFLEAAQVEQLLTRAVDYAIAAVAGAQHGKSAELSIANTVLEQALTYACAHGPDLAAKYADTLHAKVLARMAAAGVVPAEASAALLGVQVKR